MKNEHAQNMNLIKMLKKLSKGKCAGCVFNCVGTCSILDVHQCVDSELSNDIVTSDNYKCTYIITHQDLSDYLVGEYLYCYNSEKPVELSDLYLLVKKVNNYKECT